MIESVELELIQKQVPREKTLLENLTRKLAPGVRATFINSIERLRGSVSIRAMVDVMELRGPEAIVDAVDWDTHERKQINSFRKVLGIAMASGVDRMGRAFRAQIRRANPAFKAISIPFDPKSTAIQSFIESQTGRLIKDVNTVSRLAVQDIVSNAIARGETPLEAAKFIKNNIMGLTPRQSKAVDNFKNRLVDQGIKGPRVKELTNRFSERQLKLRANNIAQTELTQAVNQAQMEVWDQAIDQGVLNREKSRKVWVTTPGTPDDDCDFADGQTRRLDEAFDLGEFGSFQSPPAHVACYKSDTEVLTNQGWKMFIDVTMKDRIFSCDLEGMEYEWVGIEAMFWKHAETLTSYKSPQIDLVVSEDHRHVTTQTKQLTHKDDWHLNIKTDDKISTQDSLIISYQSLNHTNTNIIDIFPIPMSEINVSKENYQGPVWGITLERNNTLFVKRNGKVTLSGNCLCDMALIVVE